MFFWIQKELIVLRGLKEWFQKPEIQGLRVLLIICLFSFSPFSPPREVGKHFFKPEFALKSFLILCAFPLDIEIIFSCLIQLLLRSPVSCRKWGCFAVSFEWCCIFTLNRRVHLSYVSSISRKLTEGFWVLGSF